MRRSIEKDKTKDKDKKPSVLEDLKAKKEEVAKAPKKEQINRSDKSKGGEAI